MPSNKGIGAGNQQERLGFAHWITGFTDGEGCFSVAIIRNSTTRFGKQIFPEYVVSQGAKSLPALERIREYFGCGRIFVNKRYDNHNEHLHRYCVRSVSDLNSIIIPFFNRFNLYTHKKQDFLVFKKIVAMMSEKKHLKKKGWNKVLELASSMNRKKKRS